MPGGWLSLVAFHLLGAAILASSGSAVVECEAVLSTIAEETSPKYRLDARGPVSWKEYGEQWTEAYQRTVLPGFPEAGIEPSFAHRNLLRAADEGHPQIALLRELGFGIHTGKVFGIRFRPGRIEIPPAEVVVQNYERLLQKHVAAGRIKSDETIRPGRAFLDGTGEIRFVDYRTEPEATWKPVDISTLPSAVLGRMIAKDISRSPPENEPITTSVI